MLFNSYAFLFAFLPATCLVYFALNRWVPGRTGLAWLFAASCFFSAHWNWKFLPLLLGSIAFNFAVGWLLQRQAEQPGARPHRVALATGVIANLALLGYFKYADFFVANTNALLGAHWLLPHVILPLGISFFTFTQIAYLVDAYRGQARELSFADYGLVRASSRT
ncbi:MAG: hypothetical protein IPO58_06825 [Betaproteobacteria bacterium]|nr:hypothetical protein [Betaproteobacteria bacterium]